MKVTADTPCDVLLQSVHFPGKAGFINPVANLSVEDISVEEDRNRVRDMLAGRTMLQLTISELASIDPNWNTPSIIAGMQAFADCAGRENFYHDIYSGTPLEGETALMAMIVPGGRRFVVVCAGGGYGGCATMIEAFPLAMHLNKLGISAFVLHYRVGKQAHYPNPMDDLAAAVQYILSHAEKLDVSRENYGVMGFSAGGHLTATFGCESIGYAHYGLPKPGCLFLGYPVIDLTGHDCSTRDVLLQEDREDRQLREKYSVQLQATKAYPPTFLWQCSGDRSVPVSNSKMLADVLSHYQIPHVYEVFDAAAHSWGLGTGTLAEGWLDRAVQFWNKL